MRYVRPELWPLVLAAYPVAGVASHLGWAQKIAEKLWNKPGLGTFAVVNLVLPLCAVVLAATYPRVRTALVGAVLLTLGMVAAAMFHRQPRFWTWTPPLLADSSSPIQIPATIGYAVIGAVVALAVRPWRRVGLADEAHRCGCGYLLRGIESGVCPECGLAISNIES